MVSSLAAQLAKGASANTHLLVDRTKRKYAQSYLFTGKEAEQYDIDSIQALAVNGFAQLVSLDPSFSKFGDLVDEKSKHIDRTLLRMEDDEALSVRLRSLLVRLGDYFLETPTAKVLEWLVRRYRVNEFNVDDVLRLFLPYHESPHFVKMLSILHIKETSKWSFLLPVKETVRPLHRTTLVTHMLKNIDVTRFVVSLPMEYIKANDESVSGSRNQTLYAFNTGTMLEYFARVDKIDEPLLALLLPSLLEPLDAKNDRNCILGNYILLSALSQKCKNTLTPKALLLIVNVMLGCGSVLDTRQVTTALIAVINPQELRAEGWPKSVVGDFVRDVNNVLPEAFKWNGVEKLVIPLLGGLAKKSDKPLYLSVLNTIINSFQSPRAIISSLVRLLIDYFDSHKGSDVGSGTLDALLVKLNQRHLDVYEVVLKEKLASMKEGERRELEERLFVLFNGASSDIKAAIHGTEDADVTQRVAATRKILKALTDQDGVEVESSEGEMAVNSLLARITETELSILEVMYSEPKKLLSLLSSDSRRGTYFTNLQTSLLNSLDISRKAIQAHLTFLIKHYCESLSSDSEQEGMEKAYENVIFPLILPSKSRLKTALSVWEILDGSKMGGYEVISGCVEIIKSDGDDYAAKIWSISYKIAQNILSSNEYNRHLESLLSKAQDGAPGSKNLALLILLALIRQLRGEHRVEASLRTIDLIRGKVSSFPESMKSDSIDQFTSHESLSKSVYSHTHSVNTEAYLCYSLLNAIASTPAPMNTKVDWVGQTVHKTSEQTRGVRYAEVLRGCYVLATCLPPALAFVPKTITTTIFQNVGFNSACLLTSIFTSPSFPSSVHSAALKHVQAFILSRTEEPVFKQDFQIILPALLSSLTMDRAATREAACDCIAILATFDQTVKDVSIYAFDGLYGSSSNQLQYLSWEEVCRYMRTIAERRTFFISDASYLPVFHAEFLKRVRGETSKESQFKLHINCFLLSHVLCWNDDQQRVSLLKLLSGVSHSSKLSILWPLLKTLPESRYSDDLTRHLLACFDCSVNAMLNEKQGDYWRVFSTLVSKAVEVAAPSAYSILFQKFEGGLKQSLSLDRRLELTLLLCKHATMDSAKVNLDSLQPWVRELLRDSSVLLKMLDLFHPQSDAATEPYKKRVRVTSDASKEAMPPTALSLLLDSANTLELPGIVELVSQLIETLRRTTLLTSLSAAAISQLQQQVLSSLENTTKHVTDPVAFTKSVLRIDVITDLIRTAHNPRILHQSLLLIASLSQLAPDSVLQNIMPIFTIMGSDILNRDDAYSFRVVQKTIDAAVPVLVKSLQARHAGTKMELYQKARPFLQVFADATNHIPKHRRSPFFIHLARAFDLDVFVAPLLLLLVEKQVFRSNRSIKLDTAGIVSVCLSVIRDGVGETQAHTITDLLEECRRLMDPSEQSFLEAHRHSDKNDSVDKPVIVARQVATILELIKQALPLLSSEAVSTDKQGPLGGVLSKLMSLLTIKLDEQSLHELRSHINDAVKICIRCMHVEEFINAVLEMLSSQMEAIQVDALEVLRERIPLISTSRRVQLTVPLLDVARFCVKYISLGSSTAQVVAPIGVLHELVSSSTSEEHATLAETIPVLLMVTKNMVNEDTVIEKSMCLLENLISKLGPRTVPYFNSITETTVNCLETQLSTTEKTESVTRTRSSAARVVTTLLNKLSSFWTSDGLAEVIRLCMRHDKLSETEQISRAIVKDIPPEMCIPTLVNTWETTLGSGRSETTRHLAFYNLLRKVLHQATRPEVLENLKPLSKLFENAFELHAITISENEDSEISGQLDTAFFELVFKLNESSFKPLFRRLADWASGEEIDFSPQGKQQFARWSTFCTSLGELVNYFKALLNPFILIVLDRIYERLEAYSKQINEVGYKEVPFMHAWGVTIAVIEKIFVSDDETFWREEKLNQILPHLAAQVPIAAAASSNAENLQQCFNAFGGVCRSEDLMKRFQLGILMHTRSEEPAVKICALNLAKALWEGSSATDRLAGYAMDTATFIAECAEDEHDEVAKAARSLRKSVEAVGGSLEAVLS